MRPSEAFRTLRPDPVAGRIVPPTGFTATLTVAVSAAMAFLAVFALALSFAAGRMAETWGAALDRASTVRIAAPAGEVDTQIAAALRVLQTTPGIESARALTEAERGALLEPWFGEGLPLDTLPIPHLVQVVEGDVGYDAEGLRLRLAAEAPAARLEDHGRWRRPLAEAATRLRWLGWTSAVLIGLATAAMITLAANAALSANRQVIEVLRLIGATDDYVARAFVRRFTLRAAGGAAIGALAGVLAILAMPDVGVAQGLLSGLGFTGAGWLAPALLPLLAGGVAFAATRLAAMRLLGEVA